MEIIFKLNNMRDYSKNFETLMTGHLGITTGEGDKNTSVTFKPHGNTSYDTTADIRDALNFTIAGGYTNLKDESVRNLFSNISQKIGKEEAQKLFNQAFLFNQRDDVKGKSAEEKLNNFYDIGSSDPYVKKTLNTVKNFGYGIQEGFRNSADVGNQIITGATSKPTSDEIQKSKLANSIITGNISKNATTSKQSLDLNQ